MDTYLYTDLVYLFGLLKTAPSRQLLHKQLQTYFMALFITKLLSCKNSSVDTYYGTSARLFRFLLFHLTISYIKKIGVHSRQHPFMVCLILLPTKPITSQNRPHTRKNFFKKTGSVAGPIAHLLTATIKLPKTSR